VVKKKFFWPWKELNPLEPGRGKLFSFSILVNDNDGAGRRGWIEWASGIGQGKNPKLYAVCRFTE